MANTNILINSCRFEPAAPLIPDYFVNGTTGSDTNNGLSATNQGGSVGPWLTLGKAASTVPSNASYVIGVAAATYAGFSDSRNGTISGYRYWLATGTVTITSQVTISGSYVKLDGFRITVGDGNVGLQTNDTTQYCVFRNLTMYESQWHCNANGLNNIWEYCDLSDSSEDYFHVFGSGHIFRNLYIHNHIRQSVNHSDVWQTYDTGTAAAVVAQNILVEKCHVFLGYDSTGQLSDETTGSLHCFMWKEEGGINHASGLTIRNNIFESIGGLNGGGAAEQSHLDDLKVYNNIWRNDDDISRVRSVPGIGLGAVGTSTGIEIRNNLFIDGTQGVSVNGNLSYVASNNLFWRQDGGSTSNPSYSSSGGDIVNTDPQFVTYSRTVYNRTSEYKLQSGSPAKNAGITVASVSEDYEGTSRPQGGTYDIGPYEG